MGVHGLWTLLQPVARPVTLETLRDKRLAIDASMWLYQFQMATRDRKTGDVIYGAHIMGTFRRIMKLLFYGVKPVFVFDGDAPTLKKRTIEQRRRRKQGAGRDLAKTAQELLAAQLRSAAAEREIARRKERIAAAEAGQEWSDNEDNPASKSAAANDKPVYLEDLNKSVSPIKPRRDVLRDDYALPRIEGSLESRAKPSDPRIATEEELRDFLDDLRPEDLDLNSKFFGDLPTEVKYEIIGDLRIKTRQVNHRRVQQMRGTAAIDFSKAQIEHLMERNSYTQKLLSITDELGKSAIAIPSRVAGQRNREYVLLKQDASKGGGWVLGVKNPEISNTDPITIESTTDESVDERTDTDEFEEVGFDSPEKAPVGLPTPDVEARRALAEEAIFARFAAKKAADQLDPYLDQPSAVRNGSTDLFHGEGGAEEADPALQQALYESVQHGPLPPDDNHSSARFSGHSRDGANRTPTRPPATTTAARDIVVKIPPAPQAPFAAPLSDTDDDFEYVDAPPAQVPEQQASAPALAPPEQMPPEQMILSDTDASDEFEEVGVASTTPAPPPPPAQRSSRALDANDHSAPTAAKSASTMPVRSLLDSVLPSDSESETEQSPKRKLAPLPRGPGHEPIAPIRLSPSPDPFERFEASQQNAASPEAGAGNGVRAQDFAQAAATNSGSATDKAKDDNAAERPAPPVRPRPRKSPSYNGGPSPAELPASVPTSERALDAIQTAEMAVLPEVLASMPSPEPEVASEASRENASQQTPHPAEAATSAEAEPIVQYLDDLERPIRALQAEKVDDGPSKAATPSVTKTSKPRPTVQYLEDLENPTNVRPGPAAPGQPADDEEFFSDWSRSPSPQPRASGEPGGQPLFLEDDDPDAEEAALAMMREEEAYADVMAQLRNGSIESMRVEAEKEVARLSAQKRAEMRNADGVTRQMAIDIREMLVLFGIPFVDAPSEAEAECASLLERKLVDGIVTDDSDVFLFGGSRIYRNMFNEAKYVECYLLADLEREIGLDRSKLVRLAYLLGSDYTDGLPGVGVVAGRELLEEFPGDDGLKDFRAWWDKVQKGVDTQADTNTSWKKRFKSGHRQLVIDQGWPSAEVRQAYYRPVVDDSEERFSWGTVDLDGLRMYLHRSLGWGQAKSDSILLPLIKREQERKEGTLKAQAMVTDFFDYSAGERPFARKKQPKYASKRLQNVVQAWKDRSQSPKTGDQGKIEEMADDAVGSADEAVEAPQPKKRKRASKPATAPKAKSRKKSTAASRKRAEKERRDARAAANGGVYSSEEDLGSDREAGNASAAAGPPARVQPARKKRKSAVILEPLSDVSE